MKWIFKILTLTILVSNAFGQDNGKLYPITKGNFWGYIDKNGTTIIKPQFYAAGEFAEGLAPVRLNGTYGYIDRTGTFIISPKYDLALSFDNGEAKVFIDCKPFFIDKKGNITFQHNFKSISSFGNHTFAIAITQTDKYCLINREGKQLTDTVFKRINQFVDGLANVEGLNHLPYTRDTTQEIKFEVGVIDSTGKWIVAYGRYKDIDDYKNGYAKVELFEPSEKGHGWSNHSAIIDESGKQRFVMPARKYFFDYDNEGFYNDVAVVSIYSVDVDTMRSWKSWERTDYKGLINSDGQILFSDTSWRKLTPFTFNRAFVLDGSEKWKLINKNGKQVCDSVFDKIVIETKYSGVPSCPFQDGVAFVKLKRGWCAIDTTGKFLTEPKVFSEEDEYREIMRRGNTLFFMKDISVENPNYSFSYGFFNSKNNALVEPFFHDIDMDNFNSDVIYAMKDGRKYYITNTGKVIWKEGKSGTKNTFLNIDFMNRGYYYASSKYKKELAGFGGWGGSDNQSKPMTSKINEFPKQLQIFVDHNKKSNWKGYKGMKLYIANASTDTLFFDAQDSRLYLKIQAQNRNGEWKDIEYLPSSWCGNSYHTLFLAPKESWEFTTPIYHGEFKTKFRAQLLYKKTKDQEKDDIIYSNEFEGYINPGQFWNKREYYPSGLMDPYND